MRVFTDQSIAENIATARKARGITQRELGQMVGTTQATLAIYEGGRRVMTYPRAVAYTVACGVKLEQLLGLAPLDMEPYITPYAIKTQRGMYIYPAALFRPFNPSLGPIYAGTPEDAQRLRQQKGHQFLEAINGTDLLTHIAVDADISKIPLLTEETMAKNLHDIRCRMGMTAVSVATMIGLGPSGQSHRENHSVKSVSVLELMMYAKVFGLTVESVVGIEDMVEYDWSDIELRTS